MGKNNHEDGTTFSRGDHGWVKSDRGREKREKVYNTTPGTTGPGRDLFTETSSGLGGTESIADQIARAKAEAGVAPASQRSVTVLIEGMRKNGLLPPA